MALMDIWQILEIEPTPDTKNIKRAYAKKLKVTRPDEDPKGFQDLHWAYKTALQHAEWMAQEADDDQEEDNYVDKENSYEGNHYEENSYRETETISAEEISYNQNSDHPNVIVNETESSPVYSESDTYVQINAEPETTKLTPESPIDNNFSQEPDNNYQPETIAPAVNPFQQEGERLLHLAQLLLASNGEQAKAESWSFIMESSFILEDHFNWRLGLELLQLIREHNLSHAAQVHKIVGQEVITYLDSIFNWNANRQQILRTLGEEYQTWLDMIRDSNQTENWQDKIRGGKKLTLANQNTHAAQEQQAQSVIAPPFRRFMAWFVDWIFLFFIILLLKQDRPDLSPLYASIIFPFLYYVFFESSQLQGTIGKRLLGLKVVRSNFEPLKITHCLLRTTCFMIYQVVLAIAVVGISMNIPFATFIIVAIYFYNFSKDPTLFYDRITKTQVIKT